MLQVMRGLWLTSAEGAGQRHWGGGGVQPEWLALGGWKEGGRA